MTGSSLYCRAGTSFYFWTALFCIVECDSMCICACRPAKSISVCILACASSCPLMHCIYCFACDMSVVPSVLLKDDAPSWDANATPVAPRHPELCHSSKPRCHWRTANATGIYRRAECRVSALQPSGCVRLWLYTRAKAVHNPHSSASLYPPQSHPQPVSQSETFSQKLPRST